MASLRTRKLNKVHTLCQGIVLLYAGEGQERRGLNRDVLVLRKDASAVQQAGISALAMDLQAVTHFLQAAIKQSA